MSASGGTATYTCNTGYTLSGSSTRTCQTNEQWSGAEPTCNAVQCPELPPPSGGAVRLTSRIPRSGIAIYSCNTGNNLIGSVTRSCQIDGTWSGTAPTCSATAVGQCPELSPPSGGTVRLTTRTPGSGIAIYSCNTGNIRIGSSFLICQIDGTWNGNAPTCQGECDIGLVADHMIFPVATCV